MDLPYGSSNLVRRGAPVAIGAFLIIENPAQALRAVPAPTPIVVHATEMPHARDDHRHSVRILEQPPTVACISSAGRVPYAEAFFDDGAISRRSYAARSDQQADHGTLVVKA